MNILNEDDLLYMLYKERRKNNFKVYPKVSEIPRGKKNMILPDIDLLEIDANRSKVMGYEVKVLKYRKTSNNFPLGGFYKGLGQVLCYFQHGVEWAYLVLGLCGVPEDRLEVSSASEGNILDKTDNSLMQIWEFLKERLFPSSGYIGIMVYRQDIEKKWQSFIPPPLESSFHISPDINFKYDCLTRQQFTWAKKWLKEMEKKEKELIKEKKTSVEV